MAVCYTDGTWRAEFFVEIDDPGGCDNERLELLGIEVLKEKFNSDGTNPIVLEWKPPPVCPGIAHIWLYNSMDDAVKDDPE